MAVDYFEQGQQISRTDINKRFDQIEQSCKIGLSKGGTGGTTPEYARETLGAYTRVSLYKNTSGASGVIALSYPQYFHTYIHAMGVYYGYSNIKHYCEFRVYGNADNFATTVSMYYLTGSGNLVVRTAVIERWQNNYLRIRPPTMEQNTWFFSPDGNYWSGLEDLKIYEVIGIYAGSDEN